MDNNQIDNGKLQIQVLSNTNYPINNSTIEISLRSAPNQILETVNSDNNGFSPILDLPAPPLDYSMSPTDNQPYSEYNIKIFAQGFDEEIISGIQVFPGELSEQTVILSPTSITGVYNPIVIDAHTLWEYFPPKIAEADVKPINEYGEIVLRNVVIPETIVVHDGAPSDTTAKNYYVPYIDYIKNVASCEIYSTWPKETIKANILAIMSFTLNRVYTEWYRNKGYNFTITSSTAFDHKWTYGQTIFDSISKIADEIFNNFISKPNIKQPILTQYCDGKRVMCPNWLSQWGSKYLGDDGLSYIDILRYYYGDNVYINQSYQISGIPASYPGFDLSIGSTGDAVLQIQEQLNTISNAYSSIKKISADGIYGPNTANAVKTFQNIFNLPISSIVDFPTWYKISQIYVGVSKIGENIN